MSCPTERSRHEALEHLPRPGKASQLAQPKTRWVQLTKVRLTDVRTAAHFDPTVDNSLTTPGRAALKIGKMLLHARRSIGGRVTGRLRGWFVPAALKVDVVLRETRSRRQLLEETYRQVADLAGARLADELRSAEGVARTIVNADDKAEGFVSALAEFERSRPTRAPIVKRSPGAGRRQPPGCPNGP